MEDEEKVLGYAGGKGGQKTVRRVWLCIAIASSMVSGYVMYVLWVSQQQIGWYEILGAPVRHETWRWGMLGYLRTGMPMAGGWQIDYGRLGVTVLISLFLIAFVWYALTKTFKAREHVREDRR